MNTSLQYRNFIKYTMNYLYLLHVQLLGGNPAYTESLLSLINDKHERISNEIRNIYKTEG